MNKKFLGINNKSLGISKNIIFTNSQTISSINKDKDSFLIKSSEKNGENNSIKENKNRNKNENKSSYDNKSSGSFNNVNIASYLKILLSDENISSENNHRTSRKTLKEIPLFNKKINEEEKLNNNEFLQNLNLINNSKIQKPYYDVNQNSIDSNHNIVSNVINYKKALKKHKKTGALTSLNNMSNLDNIKLLPQEKPSEFSSISDISKIYKKQNFFCGLNNNKEKVLFYNSHRNTEFNVSNFLLNNLNQIPKINTENLADFNLKVSLNRTLHKEDKLIKLIE